MGLSAPGPQLMLPPSVSEEVRAQFGRHCQQLDTMLGDLTSSKEQLALMEFMIVHLTAQATFLRLARAGDR